MKRIYLRDRNEDLVRCWEAVDIPLAICEHGDIFAKPCQAIVSPANSFGFMDGGIDGVYTARFGKENTTDTVQREIMKLPHQELLVGQALHVFTFDAEFPVMISAPTMRVPMRIHDPIDVYLSTRAAMRVAIDLNFDEVLFPGMGTSVGMVPYDVAAIHMKRGIEDALRPPTFPSSLGMATARHDGSLLDTINRMMRWQ